MVELVGLEPTTSSLRTMRSAKKPQFGVHLAADYGPKRSNSDRLAGVCLTTFLGADIVMESLHSSSHQWCFSSSTIGAVVPSFHRAACP